MALPRELLDLNSESMFMKGIKWMVYNYHLCISQKRLHNITLVRGGIVMYFGLTLYISVNSYGHAEKVSSPNHTFFLGKLD